jgi:hypothetical protein
MQSYRTLNYYQYKLARLVYLSESEQIALGGRRFELEVAVRLVDATIFDCRALPLDFVIHTGTARYVDLSQSDEVFRLPATHCYFEFGEWAVLASEEHEGPGDFAVDDYPGGVPEAVVRAWPVCAIHFIWFRFQAGRLTSSLFDDYRPIWSHGIAGSDYERGAMLGPPLTDDATPNPNLLALFLTLGVTGLLDDKLLLDMVHRDTRGFLNQQRRRKGKPPLDGAHRVLTLNVPAVRYAVSRAGRQPGMHESPCLHWRRGHQRILWRGSEFERRTWVRRCLVGDPDKGFVTTGYRLVSHLPMPPSTLQEPR